LLAVMMFQPAVQYRGRGEVHRVDEALDGGANSLRRRRSAASCLLGSARGADQVEQVGVFGFVQAQGMGDAVDDAGGDTGGIAPLEPDVVLG